MSPKEIASGHFSADIQEFLRLLHNYEVKYVIVGGEAVIFHGHTRLTGDIDIYYERSLDNIQRLYKALEEFWQGNIPDISTPEELLKAGLIVQFGVVPNRIDLINEIESVKFNEVWDLKVTAQMTISEKLLSVHYISLDLLIRNKEQIGRPRDLEDLKYLRAIKK